MRLLRKVGLVALARRFQSSSAVILTYHGVLNGSAEYSFLNHNFIAADVFEQQLRHICEHYRPIALRDLVACYESGIAPPRHALAVTFDDGFANNYSVAYPLLRRYGVPFTIFLTTGLIDRPGAQLWTERLKRAIYLFPGDAVVLPLLGEDIQCSLNSGPARVAATRRILLILKSLPVDQRNASLDAIERVCGPASLSAEDRERYEFLSWTQIAEMASAGVEFGSHTVQHPILATLDPVTLEVEINESKRHIEESLQRPCYAFAYPNGSAADYGQREIKALRAAGYRCALSLRRTVNGRDPDLFQLDRINIGRQLDRSMFEAEAAGVVAGVRAVRGMLGRRTDRTATRHEGVRG
jgi:peptidoglycan/xylan/chitin deacetylase (PgdA/CDA1 family)